MDFQMILMWISTVFWTPLTVGMLGLIVLDVILGMAVALQRNEFDFRKIGQFYQTMVVPKFIGYQALHVLFVVLPGTAGTLLGTGADGTAYLFAVGPIVASVIDNFMILGLRRPPGSNVIVSGRSGAAGVILPTTDVSALLQPV